MSHRPPSFDPLDAPNVTHLWTQLLVEELVRAGTDTFFVAPGSRSTPLTTAVARHPAARAVVHTDERGSCFAALGYGRATGRPAAWITTSGTAVANGLPAVVEAATDGVPLLLLTADRPPVQRDTGAHQTIDQVKIFGNYVRWQLDVPVPTTEIDPAFVLTTAAQAVHRAVRIPPGPVHLNCMFRKPLDPAPSGADLSAYAERLRRWSTGDQPYTRYPASVPTASAAELDAVAADLAGVERGLLVAGRLDTPAEAEAVRRLADRLGWPLLPDITSRLRTGPVTAGQRVAYADQILASEAFRTAHVPDVVLHVGGRYVSKRLRLYLEATSPRPWIVARPDPARIDPDHRVTHHVETDVGAFCAELVARLEEAPATSWWAIWRRADAEAARVLHAYAGEEAGLSEPLVAHLLTRIAPADHTLVTASSMPVRAANRYAHPDSAIAAVYANRGASGIDGTVATAAGIAHGRSGPVTLLVGDLALLHDLNALGMLRDLPVVVVVVNNDGGGIFHFLPIADYDDVFEEYFATPHHRTFEAVAAAFGLVYHRPETPGTLAEAYQTACQAGAPALIEVCTERQANRQLHEALEARIVTAVSGLRFGNA